MHDCLEKEKAQDLNSFDYINIYNSNMRQKTQILHYPRLDTVIMVEEAIQKMKKYPTKTELWKRLPKKIMYQTFCMIIEYLEETGKIVVKDGEIIWVWDPEGIKRFLSKPHLIAR